MPTDIDQHNKLTPPGLHMLWVGGTGGIAAVLWILAAIAAADAFGDMTGAAVGVLIGAAVAASTIAGQLLLDYRRQQQHAVACGQLADIARRQDELAQAVNGLAGIMQGIADESVARLAVRDITERIDEGPPVTPPTQLRPRNGTWHEA